MMNIPFCTDCDSWMGPLGADSVATDTLSSAEWGVDYFFGPASEIVSGLIMRSMFYLIYNDHDAAVANERMARYIYNKYQKEMGGEARTTLPPYNEMKKTMVETLSKTLNPVMAEILKQRVQED